MAQQKMLVHSTAIEVDLLAAAIHEHAEQIGYMLQAYFPREKIRRVALVPGSIAAGQEGTFKAQIDFVKEEFNSCSAIDTELKDQMTITIVADKGAGTLHLAGETWPEL